MGLQPTVLGSNGATVQKKVDSNNIITGLRNVVWPPEVANSSSGRTSSRILKAPEPTRQLLLLLPSEEPTTKTGADGAGPSECTAGVAPPFPREPGTGRLRRTIPGRLCPRYGTPHQHPVATFPSLCAPRESSPAAQRTGGRRRVVTRKVAGELATRRARDPAR